MDKYFVWIHYERLRNHNKAKHNKTVCIFLGIYCTTATEQGKAPDYDTCIVVDYDHATANGDPGARLNIKTVLSTYGDFHVKDKTAARTSNL